MGGLVLRESYCGHRQAVGIRASLWVLSKCLLVSKKVKYEDQYDDDAHL